MAFTIPTIFTAINRMTRPVQQMAAQVNSSMAAMEKKFKDVSEVSKKMMVGGAVVGTVIAAPLVMATKQAIAFEDQMADVAKTTGLSGQKLKNFGDSLLNYSGQTRTSIEELTQIAAIGGSMGIAQEQLEAFTISADKFNIALGKDFGGVENAVKSVASLRNLYKETRGLEAADSINKVGSAINALTTKGASAQAMTDFAQRLGALPDALKPSIKDTIAMGAVLDKAGISAEVAASGMTQLTSLAGRSIPEFAKQMKLSVGEAANLLNTDPSNFAFKLAESFKGMNTVQISERLKEMKVNSNEVMKMIGALGSNYFDFTVYQTMVNQQFDKGNSLAIEAATKNETLAGKISRANNNLSAMGIIIGSEIIPTLTPLIMKANEFISSIINWIRENRETTRTIIKVVAGIAALSFAISAISSVIQTVIIITKIWRAAQVALNFVMNLNPIGLMVLGIAALIAAIILVIKYYDKWGKYVTLLLGPLGMVIDLVMTVKKHWDAIVSGFKEGGILEGFKAIGRALLDFLLSPLRRVLELIGKIPGAAKLVQPALDMMNKWTEPLTQSQIKGRSDYEHIMKNMEAQQAKPVSAINPKAEQNKALASTMTETINNKLSIDINGNPRDFSYKAPTGIPVKLTPNIG